MCVCVCDGWTGTSEASCAAPKVTPFLRWTAALCTQLKTRAHTISTEISDKQEGNDDRDGFTNMWSAALTLLHFFFPKEDFSRKELKRVTLFQRKTSFSFIPVLLSFFWMSYRLHICSNIYLSESLPLLQTAAAVQTLLTTIISKLLSTKFCLFFKWIRDFILKGRDRKKDAWKGVKRRGSHAAHCDLKWAEQWKRPAVSVTVSPHVWFLRCVSIRRTSSQHFHTAQKSVSMTVGNEAGSWLAGLSSKHKVYFLSLRMFGCFFKMWINCGKTDISYVTYVWSTLRRDLTCTSRSSCNYMMGRRSRNDWRGGSSSGRHCK